MRICKQTNKQDGPGIMRADITCLNFGPKHFITRCHQGRDLQWPAYLIYKVK